MAYQTNCRFFPSHLVVCLYRSFVYPERLINAVPHSDAVAIDKEIDEIAIFKPELDNDVDTKHKEDLHEAYRRIADLERKLASLSDRTPQKYPEVTYLNFKNRKRILVTGGAGFVGSHLVDQLMMQGHEIIVADNFFTGRKRNVEHWLGHENFELIHHDIVNPLFIEVDEIYHLASPASPPHYMFNPVKTIKTNTMGRLMPQVDYFKYIYNHACSLLYRNHKYARSSETSWCKGTHCQYIRSIRRPQNSSAARDVLGPCKSHRTQGLL